jgi:deoxyribodipyrimidine photo-lyase
MQTSQRAECNHALEYAIRQANDRNEPVVVLFGLTDKFPEANVRHYTFMLQGLSDVKHALYKRGIQFVVQQDSPERAAARLAKEASLVVTDRGYLRIQRTWRAYLAQKAPCPVIQVETDVIIPVETALIKEAYSAAILRPKIHKRLHGYLVPLQSTDVKRDSIGLTLDTIDIEDPVAALRRLHLDQSVAPVDLFVGGTQSAKRLLDMFIAHKLKDYAASRSDPGVDLGSHMSPYLHFGQISPLHIALKVLGKRGIAKVAKEVYLEELIVRRELSMNFVYYNPAYDTYACLPAWAKDTLRKHVKDKRPYLYSRDALGQASTHDPYWNAAQREMVHTGKMHNYMRMYWGKKILEWSETPQEAFQTALYLNNKYELDGRDPNGFAGVAWCFGKHDRAWAERLIFGKVRYMNAAGLEHKFDMERYVQRIESAMQASPAGLKRNV